MQTHFDLTVLARPEIRTADEILRKCVHCGFCTATCPTYVLTGDERDSPRGRIWMMRDMLGGGDTQTKIKHSDISHHLDRCLTCLSCMTTCPSGVDYMHLVDVGRAEIEKQEKRPWADRLLRHVLSITVPYASRFHLALRFARLAKPFAALLPGRMKAMVDLAPARLKPVDPVGRTDDIYTAEVSSGRQVMLLAGCAQRALDPEINAATIRLLNRQGRADEFGVPVASPVYKCFVEVRACRCQSVTPIVVMSATSIRVAIFMPRMDTRIRTHGRRTATCRLMHCQSLWQSLGWGW